MRIAFIGAGNVAWHLAPKLDKSNHSVIEIYSRQRKNAALLCDKMYHASVASSLDFSTSKAEIFIIAVPDDALTDVLDKASFPANAIVVHTSGSQSMAVFDVLDKNPFGVFYPLQTFSKDKPVDFKSIPICIEAKDETTENILEKLAFSICENVCFYNSEDRKILHLSAVFACNFTNHLLQISEQLLKKNGLNFDVLKPLIRESVDKAISLGPEKSQTGPAVRGDKKIIKSHMRMLDPYPEYKSIYQNITDSIISHIESSKTI